MEFDENNLWQYYPVKLLWRELNKDYSKCVEATYYYKGRVYSDKDKPLGLIKIEVKDENELDVCMPTTTPSFDSKIIYTEYLICDGDIYSPNGGKLYDDAKAKFDKIVDFYL